MAEYRALPPDARFALAHGIGIGFAIAAGIVGELRREHPSVIGEALSRIARDDRFIGAVASATEQDVMRGEPSVERWTALVRSVIDLLPAEMRRGLRLVSDKDPSHG